jgi:hypothetical protein
VREAGGTAGRRQTENTLAHVWKGRVRRLLFFTYRFDSRWFQDCVLSPLRRQSLDAAEIDVIATRFADEPTAAPATEYGDLYALDEWAKWRGRLRIHYLPTARHLFHNKFILVERAGKGGLELGVGSSNLTNAGWARNFETWAWTQPPAFGVCAGFLRYLLSVREANRDVLEPWLTRLPRPTRGPREVAWLFGDKSPARRAAFRGLAHGVGRASILRIVSPYFDGDSEEVLAQLLEDISMTAGIPRRIELWVDSSGSVARSSDYNVVLKLLAGARTSVELRTVVRPRLAGMGGEPEPAHLHAKVIELEDTVGRVRRLLGSANFTGAAWLQHYNTESVYIESATRALPALLAPVFEVVSLSESQLRRLQAHPIEPEPDKIGAKPCIYWVSFDEASRPRCLTVCYEAKVPPTRVEIKASFHPTRDRLPGRDRRDYIVRTFESPASWRPLQAEQGLVRLAFQPICVVPERARVTLHFEGGVKLDAPVEITAPDFDHRDLRTGIPFDASVDGLAGQARPIVSPLARRTLSDVLPDDVDIDDDEELTDGAPESLVDDPDYRRVPLAVRLAKALAQQTSHQGGLRLMREQCEACLAVPIPDAERVVVTALRQVLEARKP